MYGHIFKLFEIGELLHICDLLIRYLGILRNTVLQVIKFMTSKIMKTELSGVQFNMKSYT